MQGFIDRNGHARFYFRRTGFKRVVLPGLPWSPEFMAAYRSRDGGTAAEGDRRAESEARQLRRAGGILLRLGRLPDHEAIDQGVYNNAIERLCKSKDKNGNEIGTLGAATLRREHVVKLMKARAEKPDSANLLRKVLRAMMQHAVEIGLRTDDPTRDVKAIRGQERRLP